ncbi:MAG: tetratricopeptide repeat protein [Candidatus Neomarinimicrobiota bacterium]
MDRAQIYYRQSIEIDPQYHWPHGNLGGLLIENDLDIAEGLALVDKALELDPANPDHLEHKGWCLYKQGQYVEALAALERSWEQRPYYWHESHTRLEAARKAVAEQRL